VQCHDDDPPQRVTSSSSVTCLWPEATRESRTASELLGDGDGTCLGVYECWLLGFPVCCAFRRATRRACHRRCEASRPVRAEALCTVRRLSNPERAPEAAGLRLGLDGEEHAGPRPSSFLLAPSRAPRGVAAARALRCRLQAERRGVCRDVGARRGRRGVQRLAKLTLEAPPHCQLPRKMRHSKLESQEAAPAPFSSFL
jgi:hypothetical protein